MRSLVNIFWLGTKELRGLPERLRPRHLHDLRVYLLGLHPGEGNFVRGSQRVDRLC